MTRFRIQSNDGRIVATEAQLGGLHFYGLCARCNGVVQGRWDAAYCEMAAALWPLTAGELPPPILDQFPIAEFSPGGVARFVLSSAFALNPTLREKYQKLADDLVADRDPNLPTGFTLRLGLKAGPFARITGSMFGSFLLGERVDNKPIGMLSYAQIYFRPLAWQIADADDSSLLSRDGWVDVTNWLNFRSTHRCMMSSVLSQVPFVEHPSQNAAQAGWWSEGLAPEACVIVESAEVPTA